MHSIGTQSSVYIPSRNILFFQNGATKGRDFIPHFQPIFVTRKISVGCARNLRSLCAVTLLFHEEDARTTYLHSHRGTQTGEHFYRYTFDFGSINSARLILSQILNANATVSLALANIRGAR